MSTDRNRQGLQPAPTRSPAKRRVDLHVPFADKNRVKALGARWDPIATTWYAPIGVDLAPFARWMSAEGGANVFARSYCIAESLERCWKCVATSVVLAACLPDGHQQLADDEFEPGRRFWLADECFVSHVKWLPSAVAARFMAMSRNYRLDFSQTIGCAYWMNHCESCGAKLGDFSMFRELGSAFHPSSEDQALSMRLTPIAEPYEARGSVLVGDFWCASMPRRPLDNLAPWIPGEARPRRR